MSKPGLMIANNLEDLAAVIGGYLGMADGVERKEYMDGILTRAFKTADKRFNAAAATAAEGGAPISHMYEYNTTGVTPGKDTLNPRLKRSRLWKTEMLGAAGRKEILYVFLPAKQRNPPHTVESTGINPKYQYVLDMLKVNTGDRKYVWPRRAEATEKNYKVAIAAKQSERLFVPKNQGLDEANSKPFEDARGFAWRKTHIYYPGDVTHGGGKFNGFFLNWWQGSGATSMGNSMIKYVNRDVRNTAKELGIKRGGLKPAHQVRIEQTAAGEYKRVRKQYWVKARGHKNNEGQDGPERVI